MTLTKAYVREVLHTYVKAWQDQNPNLITQIFTPDATYHERVLGDPIPNREAIWQYWVDKVVNGQANISCQVRNVYVDSETETAVAEWEAEFDDLEQGVRKHMKEIAVLEFDGPLIASLREYWASERTGELGVSG